MIPPFGTNQRKYKGVLGTHRLVLGDGYALHGTDKPESIGRSVSHGCVRLRIPHEKTADVLPKRPIQAPFSHEHYSQARAAAPAPAGFAGR